MKKYSSFQLPNLFGAIVSLFIFSFTFLDVGQLFTQYTCIACQITNPREYIFAIIGIYFIRSIPIIVSIALLSTSFQRLNYDDEVLETVTFFSKRVLKIAEIDKIDKADVRRESYWCGFYSNDRLKIVSNRRIVGKVFFEELLIHLVNKNPTIVITDTVLAGLDPKIKDYILKHSFRLSYYA
jgi:hypothetical protein